MPQRNTVARFLDQAGLAVWFGGSLLVAASPGDERLQQRWSKIEPVAVAAHAMGGAVLTKANKGRILGQQGVARAGVAKSVVTGLAVVASAASRRQPGVRWAVPALTGALVAIDAQLGEQQRPGQVVAGVLGRVLPDRLAA